MGFYRTAAVLVGVLATALFVLAVGTFYGYWPTTMTGGLTAGALGVLGFLAAIAAAGLEVLDRRHATRSG